MSEVSTLVSEEHFRYVAEHTTPEDSFLTDLKTAAREAGIPPIWIAPEQASFMQIQLKLVQAHEVIEVGTLAGYSAIAMARALPPGGRVRTIELEAKHADFARAWIAKSDVADRVEVIQGSGMDVIPTFETGSADAAFLDADKFNYPFYFKESLRVVRKGGLIMVDNAFAFGELFSDTHRDREAPAVKAFNEVMASSDEVDAIIVPLGDGVWVGVKK